MYSGTDCSALATPKKSQALVRSSVRLLPVGLVLASLISLAAPWLITAVFAKEFNASVTGSRVYLVYVWNIVFVFTNVPLVRYLLYSAALKSP